MYAQWTLCRAQSYGTKNTLLEGKQCNGTFKRKDISFLNDVTLSLCFSCPNVLYAIQQGVFVSCDHIQRSFHKRLYGYFTVSTETSNRNLENRFLHRI